MEKLVCLDCDARDGAEFFEEDGDRACPLCCSLNVEEVDQESEAWREAEERASEFLGAVGELDPRLARGLSCGEARHVVTVAQRRLSTVLAAEIPGKDGTPSDST